MTSGYVYCSNCGTAATPGQQFCASCGTTLPAAAPAPAPAPAQPAWTAPPPATPPAPVYGAPQVPPYGQVPYGQVPYGMQMAPPPRNNMLLPVVLIVGLLVVVALVGVGVLIATSSKGTSESSGGHVVATATQGQNATPTKGTTKTPTPEPGGGNSVVITPDTLSCSGASVTTRIVITLDGSLPSSMAIKPFIDTDVGTTTTIGAAFAKQSNGSWRESETIPSSTWCSHYGVGVHKIGVEDEGDQVVVQGTITLTD
jgi:hypothetical protein